jgi:hypothetical protein
MSWCIHCIHQDGCMKKYVSIWATPIMIGNQKWISITNPVVIKMFSSPTLWWLRNFNRQACDDQKLSFTNHATIEIYQKNSIASHVATKNFWLPHGWWLKNFNHHLLGVLHYGISIYIKIYIKGKEKLWNFNISLCKNIIFRKNPLNDTKILQDITTLSLVPSFNESQSIVLKKSSCIKIDLLPRGKNPLSYYTL